MRKYLFIEELSFIICDVVCFYNSAEWPLWTRCWWLRQLTEMPTM